MTEVLLISETGEKLGKVTIEAARRKAKEVGKDLVLVNEANSVYRIMDTGKLKYEKKAQNKKRKAQKRINKVKEIKIRPTIDTHDLNVKMAQIVRFLEKDLKTKVTMQFRGRIATHKDIGIDKINGMLKILIDERKVASLYKPPKFEGDNLTLILSPVKS